MNDLASEVTVLSRPQRCEGCPLKTPTVRWSGNIEAPLAIVGESPGALEIAKGRPFVGDSGKLLMQCLPPEVEHASYFLTNAQQCFPPPKTKDKGKLESCARACNVRLLEEIRRHPRKVILAVGNAALWSLTGNYGLKITQERGKVFDSPLAEKGIVAAYHPSYVLRGGGSFKILRDDVRYAFSLLGGDVRRPGEYGYRVLRPCEEDLQYLHLCMTAHPQTGVDIETSGLDPRIDQILCVGFGFLDYPEVPIIEGPNVEYFHSAFHREDVTYVWHNGKFDSSFLAKRGIDARVDQDTMLVSYSLNEIGGVHGLDELAKTYLGAPDYKHEVDKYIKKGDRGFESVPKDVLYKYRLAPDCGYTIEAWRILHSRVQDDAKLSRLYNRLLLPASPMLQAVEDRGFYVDQERIQANEIYYQGGIDASGNEVKGQLPERAEKIEEIAKQVGLSGLNPNSWQQVSNLLYNKLRLKNKYGTIGTDENTLKTIEPKHPVVDRILEYREVAKAYGTYVKGVRKAIAADGAVHSTYKLHGTRTGRLSSSEPNVQNIPRDPRLKGQFIARPGYLLLDFDLDQAELRCLAALSGDPALCHIYETKGLSLHKEVSIDIWGEDWPARYKLLETDPEDPIGLKALDEYFRTKAVNFGIVYGREAPSIADEFKIETAEAQRMIDTWFRKFPVAKEFIDTCRRAPLKGRTLFTPFGRKKRFGAVSLGTARTLMNQAANFPHQSVASDITLYTAIKVYRKLKEMDVHIVNLVHDSIVAECREETVQAARELVEPEMVKTPIEWGITRIPFKAGAKLGDRWGYGKELPELQLAA